MGKYKIKLSLQEQYEDETGHDARANYSQGNYGGYDDGYVKWLECKLKKASEGTQLI